LKRPSPFYRRGQADTDSVMMTPMIDVVFLLMVFFVCTVSFQIVEKILPSQMSAQLGSDVSQITDPPPEKDFDNLVIRIGWNGTAPTWKINDQPVESIQAVSEHLNTVATIKADAPVILLGYVIRAYDAAKLAGFGKVSFAVNQKN
jgi:biopolymer transport protein ExbD